MESIVSLLKPKFVSAGMSVCRVKTGQIVFSVHQDGKRILLEVSEEECAAFASSLANFLVVPESDSAKSAAESCST